MSTYIEPSRSIWPMASLIRRLEDHVSGYRRDTSSNDHARACYKAGRYPYIPLEPSEFLRQLDLTFQYLTETKSLSRRLKFIDVGCGIGSKLVLAVDSSHGHYLDVRGIEIDPTYHEIACSLFGRFKSKEWLDEHIILGDALKHNYKPYDLIYFYCPFENGQLEKKLEERIAKTAKPGALILANLGYLTGYKSETQQKALCKRLSLEEIRHGLYRKLKNK